MMVMSLQECNERCYFLQSRKYNECCKSLELWPVTPRAPSSSPGRRADKRRDVLLGGLTLFARDGYTRASVDAIADQAGVSTRTLYNHFGDKAGLFHAVITASSSEVAERHIAIIDHHLMEVTDLEAALVALGLDWVHKSTDDLAAHWALRSEERRV